MNDPADLTDYRSLALGALVQAAQQVHAYANGLSCPQDVEDALVGAITTHHAASLQEVFPDKPVHRSGIEAAVSALGGGTATPEVLRYSLQMIDLAKRLKVNPGVRKRLEQGLDQLPAQPLDDDLSRLYQDTISTLGKRIQVTGNPSQLQEVAVANRIRTLLLAGIRFAWLWQQLGGSRWQLILNRSAVLSRLQSLLNTL